MPSAPDADDVVAAQAPLVDAGRGDPDVAVVVADREVAAGGGRHPVAVDPLHRPHDLVAGMGQVAGLLMISVLSPRSGWPHERQQESKQSRG